MLVDRHVPRGEGEQIAGNTLRISTGRYLAHEGAADAPSLLARLDTEPAEMPMRLRGECPRRVSEVGSERLVASDRRGAPDSLDVAPTSCVTLVLSNRGMR